MQWFAFIVCFYLLSVTITLHISYFVSVFTYLRSMLFECYLTQRLTSNPDCLVKGHYCTTTLESERFDQEPIFFLWKAQYVEIERRNRSSSDSAAVLGRHSSDSVLLSSAEWVYHSVFILLLWSSYYEQLKCKSFEFWHHLNALDLTV